VAVFGAFSALLGLSSGVLQSLDAGRPNAETVRLQAFVYPGTDPRFVTLAQTTARQLLESAGIESEWDDGAQPDGALSTVRVVVHLLPRRKDSRPDVSGEVALDARTRAPVVLLYMPRLADLARAIRTSTAARSSPTLATVEPGHLGGLTIAHEVGHILGLPHAQSGVMKEAPGIDDVLKLRALRLSFAPSEARRMREATAALASQAVAAGR
jgi:hypothetical protein